MTVGVQNATIMPGLLFALAPPIMLWGRSTVVFGLRKLLFDQALRKSSASMGCALRLATLEYRISHCIVSDHRTHLELPAADAGRYNLASGSHLVQAADLRWEGPIAVEARPLPLTAVFVRAVPEPLVDHVLEWAPPVVGPTSAWGRWTVVANHFSALLARQRRPGRSVRVRRVVSPPSSIYSLLEVAQAAACLFAPVCEHAVQRVAELAESADEAWLLTGYSRAEYFRIKGRTA